MHGNIGATPALSDRATSNVSTSQPPPLPKSSATSSVDHHPEQPAEGSANQNGADDSMPESTPAPTVAPTNETNDGDNNMPQAPSHDSDDEVTIQA